MTALAREETDRLRGLARAAWARGKRDDLSSDEQEAAQEGEYARTRDELLDHDIEVEVTEEQEIIFREPEPAAIDCDPEMVVESIDGRDGINPHERGHGREAGFC